MLPSAIAPDHAIWWYDNACCICHKWRWPCVQQRVLQKRKLQANSGACVANIVTPSKVLARRRSKRHRISWWPVTKLRTSCKPFAPVTECPMPQRANRSQSACNLLEISADQSSEGIHARRTCQPSAFLLAGSPALCKRRGTEGVTCNPEAAQALTVDAEGGVVCPHAAQHLHSQRGPQDGDRIPRIPQPSSQEGGDAVCMCTGMHHASCSRSGRGAHAACMQCILCTVSGLRMRLQRTQVAITCLK